MNAGAGIDHLEFGDRAAIVHDELHAAGVGELDRVGEQVDQDLSQPLFVGIDDGQAASVGRLKTKSMPLAAA